MPSSEPAAERRGVAAAWHMTAQHEFIEVKKDRPCNDGGCTHACNWFLKQFQ
jgi:hypothetical protein